MRSHVWGLLLSAVVQKPASPQRVNTEGTDRWPELHGTQAAADLGTQVWDDVNSVDGLDNFEDVLVTHCSGSLQTWETVTMLNAELPFTSLLAVNEAAS